MAGGKPGCCRFKAGCWDWDQSAAAQPCAGCRDAPRGMRRGAWGFHFTNHILRGACLGVQAGASPTPGCPHSTGVTWRSQGGSRGADSIAALGERAQCLPGPSSALSHRPRVSRRAPGGGCCGLHPGSQHRSRLCCCSLHSCRDAAAGGGPVPRSPGTPPLAKPTAPSQLGFSFALGSREMGKVPGIVFPTPQQLRD